MNDRIQRAANMVAAPFLAYMAWILWRQGDTGAATVNALVACGCVVFALRRR